MYAVVDPKGLPVSPEMQRSGDAIDHAVKRSMPKLILRNKSKRDQWARMKAQGYRLVHNPKLTGLSG
jgi:hypothetical protein